MGRTWKRNTFVLLAGLIGLVLVSDVQGQIFGRRRRARSFAPNYVVPNSGYAGWYRSGPTYSAPSASYGAYETYGGSWNYAPAYGSQAVEVAPSGGAAVGSLQGGVVGASANSDALPPAIDNRPGAYAPRNTRDIPGQPNDNRPPPEADSRGPANNNERLVPLQDDRRETRPDDRRNQEDAPPPPPAP